MWIKELTLSHFRTYPKQTLKLHKGLHFMVGNNGVGKTNFLEAIYVLGLAKSYKSDDDDLIHYEDEFAKITATIVVGQRERVQSIIISEIGKKAIVNQTEIKRLSDYIGLLNIVAFTPDSMNLIKGSPLGRRYFLDVFLGQSDRSYFLALSAFKQVLKQRNELLKQYGVSHKIDETLLDVLDHQFAQYAQIIIQKRQTFIDNVKDKATTVFQQLTNSESLLTLKYLPSIGDDIISVLQSKRKSDLHQAMTLMGPHRDDFEFYLNEKNAKDFASQGEQRLAILSITLGLVDYLSEITGEIPILLLDDVFSELDSQKQNYLIRRLIESGAQTIITTTTLSDIMSANLVRAKRYTVAKGTIKEEQPSGQHD
jgi:DNA replication and repair protein RecF